MASSDPSKRPRPGPWPPGAPNADSGPAMPPSSWAKRTGFRPKFSGETNATDSGPISVQPQPRPKEPEPNLDLESGRARPGPTSNGELSPVPEKPGQEKDKAEKKEKDKVVRKRRESDGGGGGAGAAGKGSRPNGQAASGGEAAAAGAGSRRGTRNEEVVDMLPQTVVDDDGFISKHSHMKYELRDSPGLGELFVD